MEEKSMEDCIGKINCKTALNKLKEKSPMAGI